MSKLHIDFGRKVGELSIDKLIAPFICLRRFINNVNDEVNLINNSFYKLELKIESMDNHSFVLDVTSNSITHTNFVIEESCVLLDLYRVFLGNALDIDKYNRVINKTIKDENVIDIYNTFSIKESIRNFLAASIFDGLVDDVSISIIGGKPIIFSYVDVINLSSINPCCKASNIKKRREVKQEQVVLCIRSIRHVNGNPSTWNFLYNGLEISISNYDIPSEMHDNKIHKLKTGELLLVDLVEVQEYHSMFNAYYNIGFKILSFRKHLYTPFDTFYYLSPGKIDIY